MSFKQYDSDSMSDTSESSSSDNSENSEILERRLIEFNAQKGLYQGKRFFPSKYSSKSPRRSRRLEELKAHKGLYQGKRFFPSRYPKKKKIIEMGPLERNLIIEDLFGPLGMPGKIPEPDGLFVRYKDKIYNYRQYLPYDPLQLRIMPERLSRAILKDVFGERGLDRWNEENKHYRVMELIKEHEKMLQADVKAKTLQNDVLKFDKFDKAISLK